MRKVTEISTISDITKEYENLSDKSGVLRHALHCSIHYNTKGFWPNIAAGLGYKPVEGDSDSYQKQYEVYDINVCNRVAMVGSLSVFKHMEREFAVDTSFVEQTILKKNYCFVLEPYSGEKVLLVIE